MIGDEFRPVWWEGTEEYAVNPGKVRSCILEEKNSLDHFTDWYSLGGWWRGRLEGMLWSSKWARRVQDVHGDQEPHKGGDDCGSRWVWRL